MRAGVRIPQSCDLCKFDIDCAIVNVFIASKLAFDEFDTIDEFSELRKVLGKQEYNKFCKALDYLIKQVKQSVEE